MNKIIVVIGAVFVVAVGIFLFTKSGNKTQQTNNTNTETTETTDQIEITTGLNEGFTSVTDEQPGCEIEKEVYDYLQPALAKEIGTVKYNKCANCPQKPSMMCGTFIPQNTINEKSGNITYKELLNIGGKGKSEPFADGDRKTVELVTTKTIGGKEVSVALIFNYNNQKIFVNVY